MQRKIQIQLYQYINIYLRKCNVELSKATVSFTYFMYLRQNQFTASTYYAGHKAGGLQCKNTEISSNNIKSMNAINIHFLQQLNICPESILYIIESFNVQILLKVVRDKIFLAFI